MKETYSTNTIWEKKAGFSRAVKAGNYIHISGTTATDENGGVVGNNDITKQTEYILGKIEKALHHFNTDRNAIVRTRIFIVNIDDWEKAAEAHGRFFTAHKPANTLVRAQLVGNEYLIEIEADAVIRL